MNSHFQKIGVLATIVVSFIEAACGSSTGAVVFWITLFSAAAMSGADRPHAGGYRRLM
jgi:hypothetical protein